MSGRRSFREWIEETFHLRDAPFMGVPDYMFNLKYWLGAIAASAFTWQVMTGLLLLFYYEPSNAYDSTMSIIHNVPFGSIILSSHLYGAYVMIIATYIHGLYVFFRGAYKRPRGAQWVLGVILFVLTLLTAFTGYSLTGDVLAIDAINVGRGILSALGLQELVPVIFGGGASVNLFTRLLAWHIIITAMIVPLLALHFYLAEKNGFMPNPKEVSYRVPAILRRDDPRIKPWWPRNFVYMLGVVFLTWGVILLVPSILALPSVYPSVPILFSPYPGPSPTSPQAAAIPAYPPWFFLVIYKVLDMPLGLAVNIVLSMIIPVVILLIIPLLDRNEYLHPLDRPWVTTLVLLGLVWLIELSVWSAVQPGVPVRPTWAAVTLLPPVIIIVGGMIALRRRWVRVRNAVPSRSGKTRQGNQWRLSKNAASLLTYIASVLAIIITALSFTLNPITDGPFIGVAWGSSLLLFSAATFSYFYVNYLD
ncbi:cytochrome b [Vulcanisaeta thermophila]|uniref:cytochrome b n=1 Tax=Vulcanisaeta thermophila TaxID=867917 RepID=UPI000853E311|nr:cytochrome bc complex cytochrome b subunit [Vulcanisaeta thermophila]